MLDRSRQVCARRCPCPMGSRTASNGAHEVNVTDRSQDRESTSCLRASASVPYVCADALLPVSTPAVRLREQKTSSANTLTITVHGRWFWEGFRSFPRCDWHGPQECFPEGVSTMALARAHRFERTCKRCRRSAHGQPCESVQSVVRACFVWLLTHYAGSGGECQVFFP